MRIHAIQTGRVRIKASQIVGRGHGLARRLAPLTDPEWSEWLPTCAYAIEHREGVILVDTGASASLGRLPRWHPYFRLAVRFAVEPEQEAAPQLRALGIAPADVRRVILTHMHIDHDSGLAGFPASEILASPGELAIASGLAGRLRGYLPERWPKSFDPKPLILDSAAYGPFARSRRLTEDGTVIAVATPGHTRDHLSVVVEDGDAAVFIAGDASYNEEAMLSGWIDGVGADESAELATLAAIRAFAAMQPTIYLPAHDPEAARRLAGRRTTQVPPVMRPDGVAKPGGASSLEAGEAARAPSAPSRGTSWSHGAGE